MSIRWDWGLHLVVEAELSCEVVVNVLHDLGRFSSDGLHITPLCACCLLQIFEGLVQGLSIVYWFPLLLWAGISAWLSV